MHSLKILSSFIHLPLIQSLGKLKNTWGFSSTSHNISSGDEPALCRTVPGQLCPCENTAAFVSPSFHTETANPTDLADNLRLFIGHPSISCYEVISFRVSLKNNILWKICCYYHDDDDSCFAIKDFIWRGNPKVSVWRKSYFTEVQKLKYPPHSGQVQRCISQVKQKDPKSQSRISDQAQKRT